MKKSKIRIKRASKLYLLNTSKKIRRFFSVFLRSLFLTMVTTFILFLVFSFLFYLNISSEFDNLQPRSNVTQNIFLDKNGDVFFESFGKAKPTPVKMEETPVLVVDAVLAAEDVNFFNHFGVYPRGIARAIYQNIQDSDRTGLLKVLDLFEEKNYTQGGSTITQQVIKNIYLTDERSFERKIKEIIFAIELERKYSKEDILEMYLNNVYFGEQALGIKNASKIYFGKELEELSLAEVSMLAGLPAAPSRLSPISGNFEFTKIRQEYVLNQMYLAGKITNKEASEALSKNVYLNPSGRELIVKHPYFSDYVKNKVIKKIGETAYYQGGLVVETTLDPQKQQIIESTAKEKIATLERRNVTNAAVVVINNETGNMEAMIGGVDYSESKVNVALAKRQPGSSFKPIVYMAGLIEGYTSSSMLWDAIVNFGGSPPYIPRNYDNMYRGNVTIRTALQNSLNVPAVQMTSLVGVDRVIDVAEKLGIGNIDRNNDFGLSLGLGSAEIRLVDLVGAYSVFANLGYKSNANVISKISTTHGEEIYKQPQLKEKVLDERLSYIMTNILSDNHSRRQVFGLSSDLQLGERPVAAKTGTTDAYADNWAVGYTSQYTVGVWVGNNDRSKMRFVSGIDGAAPIWNQIMRKIHTDLEIRQFERPEGLTEMWISPFTGRPTNFRGRPNILEHFIPGTEPEANERFEYLDQFRRR